MFLSDILTAISKKQIEHLKNIKHKEDFDIDGFLRDNVILLILRCSIILSY